MRRFGCSLQMHNNFWPLFSDLLTEGTFAGTFPELLPVRWAFCWCAESGKKRAQDRQHWTVATGRGKRSLGFRLRMRQEIFPAVLSRAVTRSNRPLRSKQSRAGKTNFIQLSLKVICLLAAWYTSLCPLCTGLTGGSARSQKRRFIAARNDRRRRRRLLRGQRWWWSGLAGGR